MPYNLLSNLTLLVSILGIIVLVLRKLPQAVEEEAEASAILNESGEALASKGLPARAVSRTRSWVKLLSHKVWQFMLEAKGLKHAPKINYNFKRILKKNSEPETKPPIARSEQYYIDLIKRHPKDLFNYDQLGQFYMEARKYPDSANVYEYLSKHDPANSSYFAKLGLSRLHAQQFDLSAAAYEQAMKLDPSHPNRYYNLALAYQGQKMWSEAVRSLKKALDLEPRNQKYADLRFELESKLKTSVPVENIHKRK
jgi:tetratricopeptide (TPR) repeat protein